MIFRFLSISFILLIILSGLKKPEQRVYLNDATFVCNEFQLASYDVEDSIPDKKLVIRYALDGSLHSYCRRIQTDVCMKSECKPIDITLHWTLTGRYLGYELTNGEYLSKIGHEPFNESEYLRLHKILSDPYSPLRDFDPHNLLVDDYEEIDAISSATNTDIEDYIVKDALFTSYTLWHIVYGSTSQKLMELTREKLGQQLILKILNSSNKHDVIWGLKNMPEDVQWTDELILKVIELTKSSNYLISEQAVVLFDQELLTKDWVQMELFADFNSKSFLRKRNIIRQLMSAPSLNAGIEQRLINELPEYGSSLVKDVLKLRTIHHTNNLSADIKIADLLKHDNDFIAREAYQYLNKTALDNNRIKRLMKKYRSRGLPFLTD